MEKLTYTIGNILPNFTVVNAQRQASTLHDEMGEAGLLIHVLRGTWCPFCVHQLMAMSARYPKFTKRGVTTTFIIPEEDYKVSSFVTTSARPLPFGLFADEKAEITEQLTGKLIEGQSRKIGLYLINTNRELVWSWVGYEDTYPATSVIFDEIEKMKMQTLVDTTV